MKLEPPTIIKPTKELKEIFKKMSFRKRTRFALNLNRIVGRPDLKRTCFLKPARSGVQGMLAKMNFLTQETPGINPICLNWDLYWVKVFMKYGFIDKIVVRINHAWKDIFMTYGFWSINSQRLLLHYKHTLYDYPINMDLEFKDDKPAAAYSSDSDGPEPIVLDKESYDWLLDIDTDTDPYEDETDFDDWDNPYV